MWNIVEIIVLSFADFDLNLQLARLLWMRSGWSPLLQTLLWLPSPADLRQEKSARKDNYKRMEINNERKSTKDSPNKKREKRQYVNYVEIVIPLWRADFFWQCQNTTLLYIFLVYISTKYIIVGRFLSLAGEVEAVYCHFWWNKNIL